MRNKILRTVAIMLIGLPALPAVASPGPLSQVADPAVQALVQNQDVTVVEGEIVRCSPLPDLQEALYENCCYSVELSVNGIFSGHSIPRKVNLIVPGFFQRKAVDWPDFSPGNLLKLTVLPEAQVSEDLKTVMIADELELYDAPSYWLVDATAIKSFAPRYKVAVASPKVYHSAYLFPRSLPAPEAEAQARIERIQRRLEKLERILEPYQNPNEITHVNISFSEAWKLRQQSCVKRQDGLFSDYVGNGYFNLPEEFKLLNEFPFKSPYSINGFENLVCLNRFLAFHHVKFIIVLTPSFSQVAARMLMPEFKEVPDLAQATLAYELLRCNVEAIYALDEVLEAAEQYPYMYFYFNNNNHPAWGTQEVLARMVASCIERDSLPVEYLQEPGGFSQTEEYVGYGRGYVYSADCRESDRGKPVLTPKLLYKGQELAFDSSSPVLVWGNSFSQTPNLHGAFPELLSRALSARVAYILNQGPWSFSGKLKQLLEEPDILSAKRYFVMPMATEQLVWWTLNLANTDRTASWLAGADAVAELKIPEIPFARRTDSGDASFFAQKSTLPFTMTFDLPERASETPHALLLELHTNSALVVCGGMDREYFSAMDSWQRFVVPVSGENSQYSVQIFPGTGSDVQIGFRATLLKGNTPLSAKPD